MHVHISCVPQVWLSMLLLVVKTSLGIGRVVATIIPQYETTDLLVQGLQIIKSWNPNWSPQCFMTDKSAQELEAVGTVHPNYLRLLCDFHRAQAIERWVNRSANGVRHEDKILVKLSMSQLAYAPTGESFLISKSVYTHTYFKDVAVALGWWPLKWNNLIMSIYQ